MRLVTYDTGRRPRVVSSRTTSSTPDFEGEMAAFVEAGAPMGDRTRVEGARLLAPLRPRSLRDFIGFRGNLENMSRRTGQPIPPNWKTTPGYFGPCIVTRDELDAPSLEMEVRVNGERWGGDTSANLLDQTIYPGDVLGSGTAAGGAGMGVDRLVQPDDVVGPEIEGIGVLRNRNGSKRG
jgi:2-keto-4-pentenoate hydratase/2-oxohepta-3-ene-1,7-dioic acid hydratase in catechol pathway